MSDQEYETVGLKGVLAVFLLFGGLFLFLAIYKTPTSTTMIGGMEDGIRMGIALGAFFGLAYLGHLLVNKDGEKDE